jgi:hypothetical protein
MGRICRAFTLVGIAALCACGSVPGDPDAHRVDARAIDAHVIDGPSAPPRPGATASTAGGGVTSSSGHQMRVRIGAPEPLGTTSSSAHAATTGPGALPWSQP